ncbi:MAG TPA: hypothetical protein VK176_00640, partial [Phycisphaerales bacterium]|nr:hypothetical protein [Phycisphaerales bacterium]
MNIRGLRRFAVIAGMAAGVSTTVAGAQGAAPPPEPPANSAPSKDGSQPSERRTGRRAVMSRDEIRQRLAQRREELRQIQGKLEEAQKLADSP